MSRPSADKPTRQRTNFRQLLSFAVVSGLICWLIESPIQPVLGATNHNQLLLREESLLEDACPFPIQEQQDFDGLTTEEVLRLRMQSVWRHPLLIGKDYEPSSAVFGRLRNRADWRELAKNFRHGEQSPSRYKLSAASLFVLNPYLLVAAEFKYRSAEDKIGRGAGGTIGANASQTIDFTAVCHVKSLTWHPRIARAEVVYDAGQFLSQVNEQSLQDFSIAELSMQLQALNALDMNLNYAAVLPHEAVNVALPQTIVGPMLIEQYLRHDGDCGRPGGCNEVSPTPAKLRGFVVHQLPARLDIRLWKNRPDDIAQTQDMRFILRFE